MASLASPAASQPAPAVASTVATTFPLHLPLLVQHCHLPPFLPPYCIAAAAAAAASRRPSSSAQPSTSPTSTQEPSGPAFVPNGFSTVTAAPYALAAGSPKPYFFALPPALMSSLLRAGVVASGDSATRAALGDRLCAFGGVVGAPRRRLLAALAKGPLFIRERGDAVDDEAEAAAAAAAAQAALPPGSELPAHPADASYPFVATGKIGPLCRDTATLLEWLETVNVLVNGGSAAGGALHSRAAALALQDSLLYPSASGDVFDPTVAEHRPVLTCAQAVASTTTTTTATTNSAANPNASAPPPARVRIIAEGGKELHGEQPPLVNFTSASAARAAKAACRRVVEAERKRHHFIALCWATFTGPSSSGVSTLLNILETAAALDSSVVEAALVVLFNLLHPYVKTQALLFPCLVAHEQHHARNPARAPALPPQQVVGKDGALLPLFATHFAPAAAAHRAQMEMAGALNGTRREVRSEMSQLKKAAPPPLVRRADVTLGGAPLPAETAACASPSSQPSDSSAAIKDTFDLIPVVTLTPATLSGYRTVRERSLPLVTRLQKRGLHRVLFGLIARFGGGDGAAASDGASSGGGALVTSTSFSSAGAASEEERSPNIVYVASLLLAALGGGTKQVEDDWASSRQQAAILTSSCVAGAAGDKAGAADEQEGSDDEDDEGDDEDGGGSGKKGGKKKKSATALGGCGSGPLKLSGVTGLAKIATLGRLGGAGQALIACLKATLQQEQQQQQQQQPKAPAPPPGPGGAAREAYQWGASLHGPSAPAKAQGAIGSGAPFARSAKDDTTWAPPPSTARVVPWAPSRGAYLSAVCAGLCTIVVGAPNVAVLVKKGLLGAVGDALAHADALVARAASPAEVACGMAVARWACELIYRILSPSTTKTGSTVTQLQHEETVAVREALLRDRGVFPLLARIACAAARPPAAASMVTASVRSGGLPTTRGTATVAMTNPALFCAAVEAIADLALVSGAGAALKQLSAAPPSPGFSAICITVGQAAAVDSAEAASLGLLGPRPLPGASHAVSPTVAAAAIAPMSAADWCQILLSLHRLLDVRELPVGSDNELAWFPPPDMIEQLRKVQQAEATRQATEAAGRKAAAAAADGGALPVDSATGADSDSPGEDDEEDEDGDDEDDGDEERVDAADDIAAVDGMTHFSPELAPPEAPSSTCPTGVALPPHTNILGVNNVNHVKPFTAPRPLPSSTAVTNHFPQNLEPLLVQSDYDRAETVKAQLYRLLAAAIGPAPAPRVVYDDLLRNTVLPAPRLAPQLALPAGAANLRAAVVCAIRIPVGAQVPSWLPTAAVSPSPTTPVPPLRFQSNFECGNLKRAIQVLDTEYDLVLHSDVNTNGFTQWFYFAVEGFKPGVPYRFNILNMEKSSSTFNDGQRPLLFSEKRYAATRQAVAWTRAGSAIAYYKNAFVRKPRQNYVSKSLFAATQAAAAGAGEKAGGDDSGTGDGSSSNAADDKTKKKAITATARKTAAGGQGLTSKPSTGSSSSKTASAGGSKSTPTTTGKKSAPAKKGAKGAPSSSASSSSGGPSSFYTLSFTVVFDNHGDGDKAYLCNCYPYSYSDLVGYCRRLIANHDAACAGALAPASPHQPAPPAPPSVAPFSLQIQNLCATLSGNATPLLTITNFRRPASRAPVPLDEMRARPVVLLSSRVHPGESNASYMIKGLIDFLLSPTNRVAEQLREQFVFKVIPMLNPDGVINGNHRCGLAGKDLNREYHCPSRWRNPTIFYLKALIYHIKAVERRSIVLYSDFHGHSRCQNSVIYGCGDNNTMTTLLGAMFGKGSRRQLATRLIPFLGRLLAAGSAAAADEQQGQAQAAPPAQQAGNVGGASGGGLASSLRGASSTTASDAAASAVNGASGSSPNVANSPLALALRMLKTPGPSIFGVRQLKQHPFAPPPTMARAGAPERLFPLLLSQFAPFFSYHSSTFAIQTSSKRNTGRIVVYRQMGIRMSYTVEASMMGGVGADFIPRAFDDFPATEPRESAAQLPSPADGDVATAVAAMTEEARCRAAAVWAIDNEQLSAFPSSGVDASARTSAAHFSNQHYQCIGAMFAKALHFMWIQGGTRRSASAAGARIDFDLPAPPAPPSLSGSGLDASAPAPTASAPALSDLGDAATLHRLVAAGLVPPLSFSAGGLQLHAKKRAAAAAADASAAAKPKAAKGVGAKKKKASAKSTATAGKGNAAPGGGGGGKGTPGSSHAAARTNSLGGKVTPRSSSSANSGKRPTSTTPSSFSGSYAASTRKGLQVPSSATSGGPTPLPSGKLGSAPKPPSAPASTAASPTIPTAPRRGCSSSQKSGSVGKRAGGGDKVAPAPSPPEAAVVPSSVDESVEEDERADDDPLLDNEDDADADNLDDAEEAEDDGGGDEAATGDEGTDDDGSALDVDEDEDALGDSTSSAPPAAQAQDAEASAPHQNPTAQNTLRVQGATSHATAVPAAPSAKPANVTAPTRRATTTEIQELCLAAYQQGAVFVIGPHIATPQENQRTDMHR